MTTNSTLLHSADGVIASAAQMLPSLTTLTDTLAFATGCVLMGMAIMHAKAAHTSHQQKASFKWALMMAIAAVFLVNMRTGLDLFGATFFGSDYKPDSILAYAKSGGGSGTGFKKSFGAILGFIQFVGLISFFRGWIIWANIGKRQDATIGKSMTHIIAGILAINLITTATFTAESFHMTGLTNLMRSVNGN